MPRLSQEKKDKIAEQVLHYLFTTSPNPKFTSDIAKEIARDEEFVKVILQDLELKKLVSQIKKNSKGIDYLKRQRWLLTSSAFSAYQKHQPKSYVSSDTNSILDSENSEII